MTSGRVFLDLTPEALTARYRNRTMAQGDALVAPFIGQWLRLAGTLDSVVEHALPAPDGRRHQIVALAEYVGYGTPVVVLWFDAGRWGLRLGMLTRGAQVTVAGRLAGVSRHTVQLRDCELA